MNKNPLDSGVPFYQSLGQARLIKPFFFSNVIDHESVDMFPSIMETLLLDFDTPSDYQGVITSIEIGNPTSQLYQRTQTNDYSTYWDILIGESSAFAWQESLRVGTKVNQLPYYKDDNLIIPILYPSTSVQVKWFDYTGGIRFKLFAFVKGYYYR